MADTEAVVNQLNECAAKQDFEGAFKLVRETRGELDKRLQPIGTLMLPATGQSTPLTAGANMA